MDVQRRNSAGPAVVLAATVLMAGGPAMAQVASDDDLRWERAPRVAHASLEQGTYGEYARSEARVANSGREWDSLMATLRAEGALLWNGRTSQDLVKDLGIDWQHDSVVLVAVGQLPAAECRVGVRQVRHLKNQLRVDVQVESLGPGLSSAVMTSPYHLVKVRRADWAPTVVVHYVDGSGAGGEDAPTAKKDRGVGKQAGQADVARSSQVELASWGTVKGLYR